MKQDVSYWLNAAAEERNRTQGGDEPPLACVNTAVEATTLNDRACCRLWAQDEVIRQHIGPDDILIVSVGGNDVALQPLLCTVLSMFAMVYAPLPTWFIQNCACACPPNLGSALDFGCMCCGVPNCVSSLLCGCPLGFPYVVARIALRVNRDGLCALVISGRCGTRRYMVDMFKNRVGNYVRR